MHIITVRYDIPDVGGIQVIEYIIFGNGVLLINNHFRYSDEKLDEMPRFGMGFRLPERFSQIEYFGRGPHENYQDRFTSAFVGQYSTTPKEMYYPYISPQENGNRTDIRWISFRDKEGIGILAVGDPLLSCSALPYTQQDLTRYSRGSKHEYELVERDFISVNMDYLQSGIGGDDSWGAKPLEKYRLLDKEYDYRFWIIPLFPDDDPWLKRLDKHHYR
jgi:beta-galactosidase